MKTCCIKGCDKEVEALGLCVNHYRMNRKHGSPVAPRPLSALMRGLSDEQRFNAQFDRTPTCWIWRTSLDKDGYGRFRGMVGGKVFTYAHRYSYALYTGHLPDDGIFVMHTCDNPSCVNPAHLQAGTPMENTQDMVTKGRTPDRYAQARKVAKLSEEQALAILQDPRNYADIAKAYGVTSQTILLIKNRQRYKFVDASGIEIVKAARGRKGPRLTPMKIQLNEAAVKEIRSSADRNVTLAARFNVTQQTICDIRKRRSWKHIN